MARGEYEASFGPVYGCSYASMKHSFNGLSAKAKYPKNDTSHHVLLLVPVRQHYSHGREMKRTPPSCY